MKYRISTSNERVWCTTQLAKSSFNHSIGRIPSWRFLFSYKKRPAVIGFLLLWSTTTVPNVTFQLSKTKVQKWFRAEYIFPRVLQEPNTLFVPGIRVISSAESRKYYKRTQHTKPHKLRHYLPGTLQQFVPAGTAVHNQQDRRRANDGGRATEGERCMYTANTAAAVSYLSELSHSWCVNIPEPND